MFGLVITLLLTSLGAVVVGSVIPGLFWLTMVALAGVLVLGALEMSMWLARGEDDRKDDAAPVRRNAELRPITLGRRPRSPARSQDGATQSRAA